MAVGEPDYSPSYSRLTSAGTVPKPSETRWPKPNCKSAKTSLVIWPDKEGKTTIEMFGKSGLLEASWSGANRDESQVGLNSLTLVRQRSERKGASCRGNLWPTLCHIWHLTSAPSQLLIPDGKISDAVTFNGPDVSPLASLMSRFLGATCRWISACSPPGLPPVGSPARPSPVIHLPVPVEPASFLDGVTKKVFS